jgi:hypothetical protein
MTAVGREAVVEIAFITRRALWRVGALVFVLALVVTWGCLSMIRMPGTSYSGDLPVLTTAEGDLRVRLERHPRHLSVDIGERHTMRPDKLREAADWIAATFARHGLEVRRQAYEVGGTTCENLEVEIAGGDRASEIVVVGGHYDTVWGSPGANDNGTGVVATLELARLFAGRRLSRPPSRRRPWGATSTRRRAARRTRTSWPC